MGQDSKIGQSGYSRLTVPFSEEEENMLRYAALHEAEIKADKKKERRLFVYQVLLVTTLSAAAFVKEKYYPSSVEWIDWLFSKF